MKRRLLAGCLAGIFCAASLVSVAACADKDDEQVTIDRDAPAYESADAMLKVDASTNSSSAHISEDLFGLFLEDINYASYALDDNMIVDSSFDPAASPSNGWTQAKYWTTGGGLNLSVQNTEGNRLYRANKHYASVSGPANGTLSNLGFEASPIAVEEGVDYIVSLFVKNGGTAFNLTATIKDGTQDYGSVVIPVEQNTSWVKYEYTLTATGTASKDLVFELSFGAQVSNLLIDSVRLETTDAVAGVKRYIYDALKDMSPKFLRFPGGCIIEGSSMETAYDWKNSVGAVTDPENSFNDVVETLNYKLIKDGVSSDKSTRGSFETRTPNTNLWAYNGGSSHYYLMDYSIGFYEYFVLCESLGAKPIPILNCGLSCQIQAGDQISNNAWNGWELDGRHGLGTNDYIQDAKDLVYFALGSVNSSDADEKYWAQVRTDMGHPAPFDLEYLGIGNEQWGNYYSYYNKFVDAFLMETNPLFDEVQLIVGNGPNFTDCEVPGTRTGNAVNAMNSYVNNAHSLIGSYSEYGIVDHHYYMGYLDFFLNTDFYDSYRRGTMDSYEVFVGEYSANDQSHPSTGGDNDSGHNSTFDHVNNSWITALSEAAYMTGLERNGDVVRLAAYAPMFAVAQDAENNRRPGNNWHSDMIFYSNNQLALTPNYYVQQIFMQNQGSIIPKSATLSFAGNKPTTDYSSIDGTPRTVTVDDVYQVVSIDESKGDVIVKIVNAGENVFKFNVQVTSARLRGYAFVTELYNDDPKAVSTLRDGDAVYPEKTTIGITGDTLGYEVRPYSVTVFRIRTK